MYIPVMFQRILSALPRAIILVVAGSWILTASSSMAVGQGHDHGHGYVDPDLEGMRAHRPRRTVSVGVFTGLGKAVCSELAKDGRAQEFGILLDEFSASDKECPACRPLMRTLSVPCMPAATPKLPKKKASSEDEIAEPTATPKPIILQRLPSAGVIRSVVEFAFEAADHEQVMELSKAFDKIEIALRSGQVSSETSRAYFDVLLEYLLEPLKNIKKDQLVTDESPSITDGGKDNQESVDSLFE